MRAALIAAALVIGVAGTASAASYAGDTTPTDTEAPAVETVTPVEETVPPSPPTTSEFGTETEIVIALDDQGTVVPG